MLSKMDKSRFNTTEVSNSLPVLYLVSLKLNDISTLVSHLRQAVAFEFIHTYASN